jgi:hypothetical protein
LYSVLNLRRSALDLDVQRLSGTLPGTSGRGLAGGPAGEDPSCPEEHEKGSAAMASVECKSMETPDETRTPDKTMLSVVQLGAATVMRYRLEPGWRWSACIKPVVGGESCQTPHLGYVVSGRLHIASMDGTELDVGAGDAYRIEPGHDAWVLGDEPAVGLEFESKTAEAYAKG